MAPPEKPKAGKSKSKKAEMKTKVDAKGKGKMKKSKKLQMRIVKTLKLVRTDSVISSEATEIETSFDNDFLEKLAGEAAQLARSEKRPKIRTRDIEASIGQFQTEELGKHVIARRPKPLMSKYSTSRVPLRTRLVFLNTISQKKNA